MTLHQCPRRQPLRRNVMFRNRLSKLFRQTLFRAQLPKHPCYEDLHGTLNLRRDSIYTFVLVETKICVCFHAVLGVRRALLNIATFKMTVYFLVC